MKLRILIFILVLSSIISGCGTSTVITKNSPNIVISRTGIEAVGVCTSQIQKVSNDIAIRLARAELMEYLNLALNNIDKELKLAAGTHCANQLLNTKVAAINEYEKRGNITTTAKVELSFKNLDNWIDNYYDSLLADDIMRLNTNKVEFKKLIYKHLNTSVQ